MYGKVVARIEPLKAGFFSLGFLKLYLLNLIADATGIAIRDEMLILGLDALLADSDWPVRVNLASIHFNYGSLVLRALSEISVHEAEPMSRK